MLAGPGVPPARRDDLDILDIAPTILAAAGLEPGDGMRGRALVTATAEARLRLNVHHLALEPEEIGGGK